MVQWCEREALGWILAAERGEENEPAKLAFYINLPIKYQLALIVLNVSFETLFNDGIDIGYLLYNDGIDIGNLSFV